MLNILIRSVNNLGKNLPFSKKNLHTKSLVVYFLHMNQKISPLQIQKPILAPLMQKSISILMLSWSELDSAIEQELQENPLLEVDDTTPKITPKPKDEELKLNIHKLTKMWDDPVYGEQILTDDEEDEIQQGRYKREITLEEYLLRQLRVEVSNPLQIKIGEYIIGNINEDGYLTLSAEEIAQKLDFSDTTVIEEVLSIIRGFDPIGIASRNIKECLLTQIYYKIDGHSMSASKIIEEHFENLGNKRFQEIARKLGISVDAVKEAAKVIAALEPKPARNFRPIDSTIYIKPDVTVKKNAAGYQVSINDEWIPPLRINRYYQELLKRPNLTVQEKEFIEGKLESAINFIKSIRQRGETLTQIVKFILGKQAAFFEDASNNLVPLTLKEVAIAIDRGESTISRAIRNKYMDTPHGVYPLKFFFSSAISTDTNGDISSRSIKEEIREIVEQENKKQPLSDQDIVQVFSQKGVHLARRTVAKYRLAYNIPPSHLRRN